MTFLQRRIFDIKEFEVSRRTVARDLDFLRDEKRAPLADDDARYGFMKSTFSVPF